MQMSLFTAKCNGYEISLDDIPEAHRHIAEMIGLQAFVDLCIALGGVYYYPPKIESITRNARNRKIRADFEAGKSYRELVEKYQISESRVRTLIRKGE